MLPKANIRIKAVASWVIFVFFRFCEMYRTPIESVNPFIINNTFIQKWSGEQIS